MNKIAAGRRAALSLGLALPFAASLRAAELSRNQTLKVICPFPPGGTADFLSRSLSQEVSRATGAVFVVENMPGAGGVVGTAAAAKGTPGQVLLLGSGGPLVVTPVVQQGKLPYDPQRDLSVVAIVAALKNVLVVRGDAAAAGFREFIAHYRTTGKHLAYGSSGVGTVPHLAGELMTKMTGISAANVPYKGNAPAITDLMAGQIDLAIVDYVSVAGLLKEGRLRAIGVTSGDRLAALPAVPTLAEQGLAGFDLKAWFGFFAPAGTSVELRTELNARLRAALATAPIRERMQEVGVEPVSLDLEGSARFWEAEVQRWSKLIPSLGLKLS